MNTLTASAFDLPGRLAAKADPALHREMGQPHPTEREVAQLVAGDLSNPDIAGNHSRSQLSKSLAQAPAPSPRLS